jgi:hypothetical protein
MLGGNPGGWAFTRENKIMNNLGVIKMHLSATTRSFQSNYK